MSEICCLVEATVSVTPDVLHCGLTVLYDAYGAFRLLKQSDVVIFGQHGLDMFLLFW